MLENCFYWFHDLTKQFCLSSIEGEKIYSIRRLSLYLYAQKRSCRNPLTSQMSKKTPNIERHFLVHGEHECDLVISDKVSTG